MRREKLVTEISRKLTVKQKRLVRITILKIKKMRTAFGKQKVMDAMLGKDENKELRAIILATASKKIIKAKSGLSRKDWEMLAESTAMQKAMAANTLLYFTPVFAGLAQWALDNAAFNAALVAIQNGVKGGAGMKTTALANLQNLQKQAVDYVNMLCRNSQATAEAIIGAALMKMTNTGTRVINAITVKQGNGTGILVISCPAAKVEDLKVAATYEKSYSLDEGKTWKDQQATHLVKTIVSGLTPSIPVICRSRVTTTKGGTTAWVISQPVTPV